MVESVFKIFLSFLILGILLPGCAHIGKSAPASDALEDLPKLQEAEKLLLAGNTLSASEAFMHLDVPSKPRDVRLRARYGMAVASLISARNLDDFNEAMVLWRDWAVAASDCHGDPRLLESLLPRLAISLPEAEEPSLNMADSQPEGLAGQLPGQEEFLPQLEGQFNTNAQINDLKRQLAWSERERIRLADQLKAQLNETVRKNLKLSDDNLALSLENQRMRERQLTMSLENERLRQQLKALEQLHLEINRKKKVVE